MRPAIFTRDLRDPALSVDPNGDSAALCVAGMPQIVLHGP
jgi:hypothetical protein